MNACGDSRLRGLRSRKPIGFRQWVVHGTLSGSEIKQIFRGLLPTANAVLDGKYDKVNADDEVKRAVMGFKAQNAEGSKFEHYYEIPLEDWFLLLRLFFLDNPDLSDMWKASKVRYT